VNNPNNHIAMIQQPPGKGGSFGKYTTGSSVRLSLIVSVGVLKPDMAPLKRLVTISS